MKIVIHFGFPKTGSSTLQFGLLQEPHRTGALTLRTWRLDDPNEHHDRRPSSCLFRNLPILESYLDFSADTLNILSDESFTAPIRLRQNNYGKDIVDPINFPQIIKDTIVERYGENIEIEALITIRNQPSQIFSQYVEEYNLKKYKNVDLIFGDNGEIDISGFDIYNYHRYLRELDRVFSKDKVHLTLFEDWKTNFYYFTQKLADVFELDREFVESALKKNHVNGKAKNKLGYFTKDGETFIPKLTQEQVDTIKAFFREDNLKLQKRLEGLYDLSDLGYL